jgi:hypothetical protein
MKNMFLLVSALLFSGSIYAENDSDGSGYDDATSGPYDCDDAPIACVVVEDVDAADEGS